MLLSHLFCYRKEKLKFHSQKLKYQAKNKHLFTVWIRKLAKLINGKESGLVLTEYG